MHKAISCKGVLSGPGSARKRDSALSSTFSGSNSTDKAYLYLLFVDWPADHMFCLDDWREGSFCLDPRAGDDGCRTGHQRP